jgi:hypothetical protein
VSIGPILDAAKSTFDGLVSIWKLWKTWKLRNQEKTNASLQEDKIKREKEIIQQFFQASRCESVGLLYDDFRVQDSYVRRIEEITQKNVEKMNDPLAIETIRHNLYLFLKKSCFENVKLCLRTYSKPYLEDLLGPKIGPNFVKELLRWATNGAITAFSIAKDSQALGEYLSMGELFYKRNI